MRDYYYERDTGIGNFEWRDSGNKCGEMVRQRRRLKAPYFKRNSI